MSITINDLATSLSVTGGTAKAYATDGQNVTNGIHFSDSSVTDFRVRPHITVKNRNPQRQSDGKYSKGKQDIIFTLPFVKADLTIGFTTARYSMEYDPEVAAASLKNVRYSIAQLLFDSEMETFHVSGSLPA